jgi:hypothetical protein
MSGETVRILREARALVEKGWTQGARARMANGIAIDPGDPNAACWCPFGAIEKAEVTSAFCVATGEPMKLLKSAVGDWPPKWNDRHGRTQAEVLAAFDRAIALAEAAP